MRLHLGLISNGVSVSVSVCVSVCVSPVCWICIYTRCSADSFHELYNITTDYYELHNIYDDVDDELRQQLHEQLDKFFHCSGQAECP